MLIIQVVYFSKHSKFLLEHVDNEWKVLDLNHVEKSKQTSDFFFPKFFLGYTRT